jgi:hypothetical protein
VQGGIPPPTNGYPLYYPPCPNARLTPYGARFTEVVPLGTGCSVGQVTAWEAEKVCGIPPYLCSMWGVPLATGMIKCVLCRDSCVSNPVDSERGKQEIYMPGLLDLVMNVIKRIMMTNISRY